MGIEFSCARGDCSFLIRDDDREELAERAREHLERDHQVAAEGYDIEEDLRRTTE